MNKRFTRILILGAACLGLALATGCGSSSRTLDPAGINAGDMFAFQSKESIDTAYSVTDAFLAWEATNRALVPASVHAFAERVRKESPAQFKAAVRLLDAYQTEPIPENRLKLANATAILRQTLREISAAMAQHQNLK